MFVQVFIGAITCRRRNVAPRKILVADSFMRRVKGHASGRLVILLKTRNKRFVGLTRKSSADILDC